jgi:hypothetical protein
VDTSSLTTVLLSLGLCIAVLVIVIIIFTIIFRWCWWNRRGLKGNYSPEKIEELHQKHIMMNVQPKVIRRPVEAFTDLTDDSDLASVENIRVDKLWQSTDTLQYASTESLQSKTV